MSRKTEGYVINVHFPNSEEKLMELRKRMGISYIKFVESYVKSLPIEDEQKNNIYMNIIQKLQEKSNL